ncbi:hypothetical protein PAP_06140 [Palaeococcus pacificus DY20341]|uniref:DUF3226 domain-containing protein n=1 Tax=Palaeococcus pacificus DY20341 TaxID=1343739 RepID=A0A075LYH6_9EURY|nr:hypothetical protein [Palaeococcus pacificus]AIF69628.1 hypothetical protein PAP_06140 [Palaeococcus pacificus DY20341]
MILIVFEGFNDLQFFKSFLIKVKEYNEGTNRNSNLKDQFNKLFEKNPGGTRIDILEHTNPEKVILLSIGGKQYFKDVAEASKALVKIVGISKILLIGDKDGEEDIITAKNEIIKKELNIPVEVIVYRGCLEDLIFSVVDLINPLIPQRDKDVLNKIFRILSENYSNEENSESNREMSIFKKRKTGIIHTILGPRCWGHLFDELFSKFCEEDIDKIEELEKVKIFLEL